MIEEKDFRFIAVEGDWPDCYQLNRYVRDTKTRFSDPKQVMLSSFKRWPTWMWANHEVLAFIEWLKHFNADLPEIERIGFYGLDVYSLWDSLAALSYYLRQHRPEALKTLHEVLDCFEPFDRDVAQYARASVFYSRDCEKEVLAFLEEFNARQAKLFDDVSPEARLCGELNALVIKNAEMYYRAMVRRGADSWNIRDRHMMECLKRLVNFHGPQAKSIVWEHNTHVGDARYTDMVQAGEWNVGQLAREYWGEDDVVLVGFSSDAGTVIAGLEWDAPMQVMRVPPARTHSWDNILHREKASDKLLIFDRAPLDEDFRVMRGQRAIGVVYHPEYEHYGNYVPSDLSRRYDALLYFDQTQALHPLSMQAIRGGEPPETYPSAV